MSSKIGNWLIFIAAILAAAVPQMLTMFDPWPKAKAIAGAIGVIAAAIVVQSSKLFQPSQPAPILTDEQARELAAKYSKKDAGYTTLPLMIISLVLAFVGGILLFAIVFGGRAHAAETSPQLGTCITPSLCVQPAVAVSAFQLNLKTLDYERVALSAGYGITYKTDKVNLGAAVYAGVGISKSTPNAPQASLLFSVADIFAFGPGVQTFKASDGSRIWQGLLTLALNYNLGGSPTYLDKAVRSERTRKGVNLYTTEDGK
jgi:hypothetical protein